MCARNYSLRSTFHTDAKILDGLSPTRKLRRTCPASLPRPPKIPLTYSTLRYEVPSMSSASGGKFGTGAVPYARPCSPGLLYTVPITISRMALCEASSSCDHDMTPVTGRRGTRRDQGRRGKSTRGLLSHKCNQGWPSPGKLREGELNTSKASSCCHHDMTPVTGRRGVRGCPILAL